MTPRSLPIERDVRLGGRWSPAQRAKNLVLRWLVIGALRVADRIPAGVLRALGGVLGRVAHCVLRGHVTVAEARIRRYLPDVDAEAVAREAFACAGTNLASCLLLRRSNVRALDVVVVPESSVASLTAALAEKKGVLFLSAHLGPFEYVPAAIRELGLPATIVVRESYDPRLDPHVDAHRTARGIEVVHRGRAGAPARILRALRQGRPVGLLPDLGARVPSRWLPFLAGDALLPIGPARLAARLGVPVVLGTLHPGPARDGFTLDIRRISGTSEGELASHVASALADTIRACPTQWLWMGAKSLTIAESTGPGLDLATIQRAG